VRLEGGFGCTTVGRTTGTSAGLAFPMLVLALLLRRLRRPAQ
jgi:uncharacterized protein (TIGR03382 family)